MIVGGSLRVSFLGYGWFIKTQFNRKLISHGGMIEGFVGSIDRYPSERVCIIVLSNLPSPAVFMIARDLGAIALGEKYELFQGSPPPPLAQREKK